MKRYTPETQSDLHELETTIKARSTQSKRSAQSATEECQVLTLTKDYSQFSHKSTTDFFGSETPLVDSNYTLGGACIDYERRNMDPFRPENLQEPASNFQQGHVNS